MFENDAWVPGRAQLPAEAAGPALDKKADVATVDLSGGQPVLAPTKPGSLRSTGDVEAGEVLVAEAPSGAWQLKVGGRSAERHPAFGVLGFTVAAPGSATLQLRTPLVHRLAVLVQLLLWLTALAVVAGGPLGRGRPGRGARHLRTPPLAAPASRTGVVLRGPVDGGSRPSPVEGPATAEGPAPPSSTDGDAPGDPRPTPPPPTEGDAPGDPRPSPPTDSAAGDGTVEDGDRRRADSDASLDQGGSR